MNASKIESQLQLFSSEGEQAYFFPNLPVRIKRGSTILDQFVSGKLSEAYAPSMDAATRLPSPLKMAKKSDSDSRRRNSSPFKGPQTTQVTRLYYSNGLYLKKLLKRALLVVVAVTRLNRLALKSPWKKYISQLATVRSQTLKYESTKEIRIALWSQGVLKKALTSVNGELYNFVESCKNRIAADKSMLKSANAAKFFFESLSIYTRPEYFSVELKHYMFSQLFLNQRKRFSQFVSARTTYLQEKNKSLALDQQTLIICETVFIENVLHQLINSKQEPRFLIKLLASLLNIYFLQFFQSIPIKEVQSLEAGEWQSLILDSERNEFVLKSANQKNGEQAIIFGLWNEQDLQGLFTFRPTLRGQLEVFFEESVDHLLSNLQSL